MTKSDHLFQGITPQAFLAAIPMPTLLVDQERRVCAMNRPAQEALGITAPGEELGHTLDNPGLLEAVNRTLLSGEDAHCEMSAGSPVPLTYDVSVARLDDNGLAHVLVVFSDITSARSGDAIRSSFVANVSHELRSPLTTMMGAVEALGGPARDDEDGRKRMLALMGQEARRMKNLIDDLLSLSRVEAREFVQPGHVVDLRPLLEGTRERLAARASIRRMTIELTIAQDLPKVTGIDDELFQVCDNLIGNAIKYGSQGSVVRVEAQYSEQTLSVSVHNEGAPIPAKHLPRLTERFYRVDKSRSRELGGTGLGLAIVKHIVNRHRGRLQIESSADAGTTVTVFLPVDGVGHEAEGMTP